MILNYLQTTIILNDLTSRSLPNCDIPLASNSALPASPGILRARSSPQAGGAHKTRASGK